MNNTIQWILRYKKFTTHTLFYICTAYGESHGNIYVRGHRCIALQLQNKKQQQKTWSKRKKKEKLEIQFFKFIIGMFVHWRYVQLDFYTHLPIPTWWCNKTYNGLKPFKWSEQEHNHDRDCIIEDVKCIYMYVP